MDEGGQFDESTRQWLAQLAGDGESLVFVRDRYRQTIYMSDNVVELTGWRSEDFVDRLYSLVHPDDQAVLFRATRDLREGEVDRLEFPVRVLMAAGGFRWFHCHLESRFDDPRVGGLVCRLDPLGSVVPDLDRHVQILATTNDVVIVFDRSLRVEYVSPSVEHVLGLTPDEIVLRWRDVLLGDLLRGDGRGEPGRVHASGFRGRDPFRRRPGSPRCSASTWTRSWVAAPWSSSTPTTSPWRPTSSPSC